MLQRRKLGLVLSDRAGMRSDASELIGRDVEDTGPPKLSMGRISVGRR